MNFLFGRNKRKLVPPNAAFRITQAGEEELQRFKMDDDQAILVALQTNGTLTVDEIARRSGLSKGTVEKRVPLLANKDQIQLISKGMIGASASEEE